MRSLPSGWNSILAKLGFKRKKRRGKTDHGMRRLSFEPLEGRHMLSITVNTALDFTDNSITDGTVSLRDAISLAPTGETINFASSLNGATIVLDHLLGQIDFGKKLTIDASMLSSGLTIDAGHGTDMTPGTGDGFRIFNITAPSPTSPPLVTLKGLTLTGGDVSGNGGAINSAARLAIIDCVFEDNAGDGDHSTLNQTSAVQILAVLLISGVFTSRSSRTRTVGGRDLL
jgi:hypothetical protein